MTTTLLQLVNRPAVAMGNQIPPGETPCIALGRDSKRSRGRLILLVQLWSQRELHTPVSNHPKKINNNRVVLNHS